MCVCNRGDSSTVIAIKLGLIPYCNAHVKFLMHTNNILYFLNNIMAS